MKKQQGFSLIELAIVLVIVTLLIGGLAMPLSAQIQARRITETKKIMEEAREAIFGYAMTHINVSSKPELPCPDTDGDGIENRDSSTFNCANNSGFFPWVTLGTAAQDAWGDRLHYAIFQNYGDRSGGISKSNLPKPDKQICDRSGMVCTSGNVALDVPVVLVSYGPNGWGALNVNGSTLQLPSSNDERENISTSTGLNPDAYITHPPTQGPANEFDDLVVWIPKSVLISRVCLAPTDCP